MRFLKKVTADTELDDIFIKINDQVLRRVLSEASEHLSMVEELMSKAGQHVRYITDESDIKNYKHYLKVFSSLLEGLSYS